LYVSLYVKPSIDAAVDKALKVAAKYDIGGHATALRWTAYHSILKKEHGDALIIGASSPEQLETNINAIEEGPLPTNLVTAFDAVYEEAGDEIKYHL
jgi:aflatoxin B1 aldehyde reductase